jgi:hypothetical protein
MRNQSLNVLRRAVNENIPVAKLAKSFGTLCDRPKVLATFATAGRNPSAARLNTFFVLVSTLIVSAIAGCGNGTDPDAQPISKNPAGVAEQKPKVSVDTSKPGGLADENAKKTEAADKKTQPKIADANSDTKVEPVVDPKKEPVEPEIPAKKLEETEFIED